MKDRLLPCGAAVGRRTVLAGLAAAPAAAVAATLAGDTDDTDAIERLVRAGGGTLAARPEPYRISRVIHMPDGCTLTIAPGTVVEWTGGAASGHDWIFVAGNACVIKATGAEIRSRQADRDRWAVCVPGRRTVRVEGVRTRNLNHVYASLRPGVRGYRSVTASALSRDVHVIGGGSTFDALPRGGAQTTASCFMGWADGWSVVGATYRNTPSGVQWWGGDASLKADGGPENVRWCRNGLVSRVTVTDVPGAGIWGSMGQDIRIVDCVVADCDDVGCDAEGCFEITWERCRAARCRNGAFAQFQVCRNVIYIDCEAEAPAGGLLLAFYGEDGAISTGSSIVGGRWRGTGPHARIAIVSGKVRGFAMRAAPTLINAVVDVPVQAAGS